MTLDEIRSINIEKLEFWLAKSKITLFEIENTIFEKYMESTKDCEYTDLVNAVGRMHSDMSYILDCFEFLKKR